MFFSSYTVRRNQSYRDRYQLIGKTYGGRRLKIIFQLKPDRVVRIITEWPLWTQHPLSLYHRSLRKTLASSGSSQRRFCLGSPCIVHQEVMSVSNPWRSGSKSDLPGKIASSRECWSLDCGFNSSARWLGRSRFFCQQVPWYLIWFLTR